MLAAFLVVKVVEVQRATLHGKISLGFSTQNIHSFLEQVATPLVVKVIKFRRATLHGNVHFSRQILENFFRATNAQVVKLQQPALHSRWAEMQRVSCGATSQHNQSPADHGSSSGEHEHTMQH